jgi:hypothetical protein
MIKIIETPNILTQNWVSNETDIKNEWEEYSDHIKPIVLENSAKHLAQLEMLVYKYPRSPFYKSLQKQSRYRVLTPNQLKYLERDFSELKKRFK